MARLASPSANRPYDRVLTDHGGTPAWGIRGEHTPDQEIVNLATGQSNVQYWQPEVVMDPTGCSHVFEITDLGRREIECALCHYATSFHPAINYSERDGIPYVTLRGIEYPLAYNSTVPVL